MPVLYSNNAYMAFFNQFYEKVLSLPETSNEDKIKFAINNYNSFQKLDLVLAEDYYLKDKRIRELAIINGLAEIYYNKYFNPNNILSIIKEIELKSQYDVSIIPYFSDDEEEKDDGDEPCVLNELG